jgi:putative intracellular protease/amidase
MPAIADARILIIATDGFEDSELVEPRRRLLEAGADVTWPRSAARRSRVTRGPRSPPTPRSTGSMPRISTGWSFPAVSPIRTSFA